MDGEQRSGEVGRPGAGPARQVPPHHAGQRPAGQPFPAPDDPGQAVTQAYPGPFPAGSAPSAGRRYPAGGPATTRLFPSTPAPDGPGASGPGATTQLFPSTPTPDGPGATTQLFPSTPTPGTGGPDWPAGFADQGGPGQPEREPFGRQGFAEQSYGQQEQGFGQQSYGQQAYSQQGPTDQGYDRPGPQGPGLRGTQPPGEDGGRRSGGPSRGVVLISLALAALAAIGAGVVYVFTGSSDQTTATTTPVATAPGPTTSPSTSPSTSTKRPAATRTPSTATATATETAVAGPAPTAFVDNPGAVPGMDFGTIVSVAKKGSGAQITVKRQQFLTGEDAQAYYAQQNQEPLDYAIVDVDDKNHTFTVSADALIYAQYLLGDNNNLSTTQLTVPQFIAKAKAVQSRNIPLRMWMYHKGASNGTVVYVAEQYTP